jgi:hypothetical protein
MQSINLFSYLKNTDLPCLSGFQAITHLLKHTYIKSLKRMQLWELTFNTATPDLALKELDNIINNSYYIINPNKEAYHLEKIAKPSCSNNEVPFLIKVTSKQPSKKEQLINKIKQKVDTNLVSIHSSLIWEIVAENNSNDIDSLKKKLQQDIIITSSRKEGVLINPLYEQANFLDINQYYL